MSNTLEDFQVGTKVTLSRNSQFYYMMSENNPQDIVGVVVNIRTMGKFKIDVEWSNGGWNGYQPRDLKILGEIVHE